LSESAHNIGRNKQKNIRVEIQDRSMSTSGLTGKILEVDVKRIAFPTQGKLDVHLGNSGSM
jgi:hypothetical protein